MIVDPSKSSNPFRESIEAEAALNEHSSSEVVSPQPSSSPPLVEPSTSYAPPPAYAQSDQSTGESSTANGKRSAPETSGSQYASTSSASTLPYAVLPATEQDVASFSRQAPQQDYPPFEPTFLLANGQYLTRGFPALPPPSRTTPHPFASHDITESDWLRYADCALLLGLRGDLIMR